MTGYLIQTATWVGAVLFVAVILGAVWLFANHLLDELIGDDEFIPPRNVPGSRRLR